MLESRKGLSCEIFRAIVARKTPNLALPSLQHSVQNRIKPLTTTRPRTAATLRCSCFFACKSQKIRKMNLVGRGRKGTSCLMADGRKSVAVGRWLLALFDRHQRNYWIQDHLRVVLSYWSPQVLHFCCNTAPLTVVSDLKTLVWIAEYVKCITVI